MSPFRWDVLGVAFLLALPVLAMGVRGDFGLEEVTIRLPWCLVAGWLVIVVLRFAATPPPAPAGAAGIPPEIPTPRSQEPDPFDRAATFDDFSIGGTPLDESTFKDPV